MIKHWKHIRNFKEVLQFFPTAEGYVSGSKRQHGFGNDGGDIDDVELVNVLRMEYQYKYNGKEYEDNFGLNMYEYGARNYDPTVGKFFSMDNYAENFLI